MFVTQKLENGSNDLDYSFFMFWTSQSRGGLAKKNILKNLKKNRIISKYRYCIVLCEFCMGMHSTPTIFTPCDFAQTFQRELVKFNGFKILFLFVNFVKANIISNLCRRIPRYCKILYFELCLCIHEQANFTNVYLQNMFDVICLSFQI